MARKGGADAGQFIDRKLVEGPDAVDSQVALDVTAPEEPERPGPRLPDFLRRLGGAPTGSEPVRG